MRITVFLFLYVTFLPYIGKGQCPPGDLILQNQDQVDYYAAECADIDTIFGGLNIGDFNSNIKDLSGLSSLKVILGGISIQSNDSLLNLNGLEGIKSVNGLLSISENTLLVDIKGLKSISAVQGDIFIRKNNALKSLEGLNAISSLAGELIIDLNDEITSISALSKLSTIPSSLRIHDNPKLTNLSGLDNIVTIEEDLSIQTNGGLESLTGLNGLVSVGRDLTISYNDQLKSLGAFESLKWIGNDLFIDSNVILSDCFEICTMLREATIGGKVGIGGNAGECTNNSTILAACGLVSTESIPVSEVKVSPNPANSTLNIHLPINQRLLSIKVVTLAGKSIPLGPLDGNKLDITKLANGLYFIFIQTNEQYFQQKFVVNKTS